MCAYVSLCTYMCTHVEITGRILACSVFLYGFPSHVLPLSLILNSLYESKNIYAYRLLIIISFWPMFLCYIFSMFTLWQFHAYTSWNFGHFSHHYPLSSLPSSVDTQPPPIFMTFPVFFFVTQWVNYGCLHAHELELIIRLSTTTY